MTPNSVLIAEDSPTQALRLRNTLEKNGFTVTRAEDGQAALEALSGIWPTLVISDVQMPRMDGFEFCRRLKSDPALRDIPLILLTSLSSPQDIIQGLASGADNFVVKPYDEDFLLARIRAVLANRDLPTAPEGAPIPIHFAGERYEIAADRRQILSLLLSTYETALQTNAELNKTHEALKAAQAQLIEAEKLLAVGRLAAGVAHEVRNPLAILEMGMDLLGAEALSETGQVVLPEMKEAVKRANDVIIGLMDLGSPSELGRHAADLHAILEKALAAVGDEMVRTGIVVERRFASDLPQPSVDVAKMGQLFINLLTNAVQAMPGGGTITITTSRSAAEPVAFDAGNRDGAQIRDGEQVIAVEIADTGPGIAPENVGKVFEPFFSTKPTGQGMGLGLTVAKKIVDVHRGRIEIRNRDAGGASARLTLKSV
jgi:signal transduction histidine kinase